MFDGKTSNILRNRDDTLKYDGLRTPWIIAGTPFILSFNQSHLGDRFLKVFIDPPSEDQKQSILTHVGYTALRNVKQRSNCSGDSIVDPLLLDAFRHTGGYVDYLRANVEELLRGVKVDEEDVVRRCGRMAELTALLRARSEQTKSEERHDSVELPTRLTHQFIRLAVCLGAVLGRFAVDEDVLRRVRKVAVDTARGRTLELARRLIPLGQTGAEARTLAGWLGESEDRMLTLLRFLKRIKVLEPFNPSATAAGLACAQRWRLTPGLEQLCKEVLGEGQ